VEKQNVLHIMIVRLWLNYPACNALPYFSTCSHKPHDFRKKVIEYKKVF
jgi:hypothetical protein